MSRALVVAIALVLVAAPAAAADGIELVTPTEGATVSTEAPLELGWANPHLVSAAPLLPPPPPPPIQRFCRVPAVRGRLLADARRLILKRLCRVGTVSYTRSPTVPRGRVVRQSPAAGKVLQTGGRVQLVVSRGRR